MRRLPLAVLLLVTIVPSVARSAGGHDSVGCVGCHGLKGVEPTTARFCLTCHGPKEEGGRGILPVSAHVSHPFSLSKIDPRVAKVPQELLRGDGRFECLSCHDPHPSNRNRAYLRVATRGAEVDAFCAVCHPAKSDVAPGPITGKRSGS